MKNRIGVTVERVTSPLVALGVITLLPALVVTITRNPGPLAHGLLLYLASFGLYCTGVAGNLVSTLGGGEPRTITQLLPLFASNGALILSIVTLSMDKVTYSFLLITAWLFLAGLHAHLEARERGLISGILAPLPWFMPILVLMVSFAREAPIPEVFLYTAFTHVVGLALWVAVGFLGRTYGRPLLSPYVVGLVLTGLTLSLGMYEEVLLPIGVGLMLFATGFWRKPWWKLGFWWAQASAFIGVILVLLTWLLGDGREAFILVHGLLLSVGVSLVVGQSIYLAPLLIAARKGRYPPGWAYLVFSVSGSLRVVDPLLSGLVVIFGLLLILVFLRPSLRWAWLILRYGTVEGYARVYSEKRHFARF